jgi:hypothetical protein
MSRLRVAAIVEGQGDVASVPILLRRIWEMLGGEYIEVLKPYRMSRGQLVKESGIQEAVRVVLKNLSGPSALNDPVLVLILVDADEDCPATLGPKLEEFARKVDARLDLACVLPQLEYETWFAASAESLSKYLDLSSHSPVSELPEEDRHGKAWIERRFRKLKYIEPQDQPAMTHAMDLALCRKRSPSFDKLCRELNQRMRWTDPIRVID